MPSNGGRCAIALDPAPNLWELGREMSVGLEIRGCKVDHVTISGAMPQHGHGLASPAQAVSMGANRYQIQNLNLHMAGQWEVYIDMTQGAVTERAQVNIELP